VRCELYFLYILVALVIMGKVVVRISSEM